MNILLPPAKLRKLFADTFNEDIMAYWDADGFDIDAFSLYHFGIVLEPENFLEWVNRSFGPSAKYVFGLIGVHLVSPLEDDDVDSALAMLHQARRAAVAKLN